MAAFLFIAALQVNIGLSFLQTHHSGVKAMDITNR